MDEPMDHDKLTAFIARDIPASILFAISIVLIVLNTTAASIVAHRGFAYVWLLEASLLLTAAFAIVGIVFGVMRSLRMSKS